MRRLKFDSGIIWILVSSPFKRLVIEEHTSILGMYGLHSPHSFLQVSIRTKLQSTFLCSKKIRKKEKISKIFLPEVDIERTVVNVCIAIIHQGDYLSDRQRCTGGQERICTGGFINSY